MAVQSEEDAEQLITNDNFDKRTQLRSALTVSRCFTPARRKKFEAKVNWLDNTLAGKSRKFHKLEQLAARAGQSDFYNVFFRYYSGPVHSSPTDLKQHVSATPDRKRIVFRMGPCFDLVPYYLSTAIFIHLKFLEVGATFFGVDAKATFEALDKRLKSFGPQKYPTWE